jgi:glyceraldehyde-3-phosphate dehydrogenase (NAD(P))
LGESTIIHVIGTGTIGEPLIGLLVNMKEEFGLDEVTFHKRTPLTSDRSKVNNLVRRGAKLCVDAEKESEFRKLEMEPTYEALEAIERATVVIDCTPSGVGISNKNKFYEAYKDNTKGFIAQGSEFGFGKMYARGINDSALIPGEDQFIQVVSCNTHNLAALIKNLGGVETDGDNLVEGRFLCIRRANDISQAGGFIPSPKVGKHDDAAFGTHHARDAYHLFKTLGIELNLFSSAMKANTQYMHAIWFDIRVKHPVELNRVIERLYDDDRVAVTEHTSANIIFSFGRDHGYYGRLLNQTVVSLPTLQVRNGNEIVGFCFTPQDGNSLLSSVAAAEWFINPDEYEEKIQCLQPFFFDEI